MGPSDPSTHEVDNAFNDVMQILKTKYHCQKYEPLWENYIALRIERNQKLKDAIFSILQLESWESF